MKKLALLMLCAVLFCSCTVYEMPSSSSSAAIESSSSAGGSIKYCVYTDGCLNYNGNGTCPGNGILLENCPYSSSSSN